MAATKQGEVLESWKEISDYLNRDVKTCRRWELNLDLPIRRLEDSSRARVFAYREDLDFWLKDKLDNREITTTKYFRITKKKSKTLWITIASSLVLIVISILLIRFLPRINFIPSSSEKIHLAVLPVKNFTNDESMLNLREAMTNLIVSDLFQSKFITVLTVEKMNKILEDLNIHQKDSFSTTDLKKIASQERITHFLNGSVTKFGEKIRLNFSILDVDSWKTTWSDNIDGTVDNLLSMVDALTVTLKPQLDLTREQIAEDFDEKIENVTTPNEKALQFYIEARRAMNKTEWNLAIELFERATAIDPDFAMAYRYSSGIYNHLALVTREKIYWEKMREYEQKAKEAVNRRPPSERERMIIEGLGVSPTHTIEAFKKLLELYPDDDYGNYRLGANYAQGGNYVLAEKHLKHIISYTDNFLSYVWLGNIFLDQARYNEAKDLFELGMEHFPNNWFLFEMMAKLHVLQQEFDNALLWCERGFAIEPIQFRNSLIKGDTLFFTGDFFAAENEYRLCLDSNINQTRIKAAVNLIHLYKTLGRFEDAKLHAEEVKQSLEKTVGWNFDEINTELALFSARKGNYQEAFNLANEVVDHAERFKLLGQLYNKMKLWAEAEEVLNQIEQGIQDKNNSDWGLFLIKNQMFPPYSKKLMQVLLCLKAKIALEKSDYKQAVDYVEQSKPLYSGSDIIPADLIEILGNAYYQLGDVESARNQYEWHTRMTYGRKKFGDTYAKSFYMLGKISDQLGNKSDARRYYEGFLDLWKSADSGIPEKEEAHNRLNFLQ